MDETHARSLVRQEMEACRQVQDKDSTVEGDGKEGEDEDEQDQMTSEIIQFAVCGVGASLADQDDLPVAGEDEDRTQAIVVEESSFDFTTLSPSRFRILREISGISNPRFLQSFSKPPGQDKAIGGGRSGSFVTATWDDKYIIKTMSQSEVTLLTEMLDEYVDHIRSNAGSLLTRYMGLFQVAMNNGQKPVPFVVMENVLVKTAGLRVQEIYDLKGSYVDRQSINHKSAAEIDPSDFSGTRKDMDLRRELGLVGGGI